MGPIPAATVAVRRIPDESEVGSETETEREIGVRGAERLKKPKTRQPGGEVRIKGVQHEDFPGGHPS
ncbi:UNVERIFIED_CONTAM: hypothetical protein Sradi_1519300 [Sesamum radiatum]|uniref:Uncharacterized protein n=1 Tax=Sesamum radiatum TaxID=300843 RepID=A0AAW2UBL9_SESRA